MPIIIAKWPVIGRPFARLFESKRKKNTKKYKIKMALCITSLTADYTQSEPPRFWRDTCICYIR